MKIEIYLEKGPADKVLIQGKGLASIPSKGDEISVKHKGGRLHYVVKHIIWYEDGPKSLVWLRADFSHDDEHCLATGGDL